MDIRERDLPQETGQARALNFTKGCYLGQEIVERIRSRGAVHRQFAAFLVDGDLPDAGTKILAAPESETLENAKQEGEKRDQNKKWVKLPAAQFCLWLKEIARSRSVICGARPLGSLCVLGPQL